MAERNFIGAAKRLDDIDLPRIAEQIGCGEDELHAFMDVEAAGSGFDRHGRPKMLFEPHVFYRLLGKGTKRDRAVREGLAYPKWGTKPYPADSYPALQRAILIDEDKALQAASWGLAQILGENYAAAGFASVESMVEAFMEDEEDHLQAAVTFIVSKGIDDDLREHRWADFARIYNGPGYKKNKYDEKLAKAFKKWAGIPDTPYTSENKPPVVAEDIYDGGTHKAVADVQALLDQKGYPEVGKLDGRYGSKTAAAIMAFRRDNGLPLSDRIDEEFLAALAISEQRPVAAERKFATVEDLRKEGAAEIKQTDQQKVIGYIGLAGGALTAATKLTEQAEQYSALAGRLANVLEPMTNLLVNNLWLILGAGGAFIVYKSGILQKIRVEKHRKAEDVSL